MVKLRLNELIIAKLPRKMVEASAQIQTIWAKQCPSGIYVCLEQHIVSVWMERKVSLGHKGRERLGKPRILVLSKGGLFDHKA